MDSLGSEVVQARRGTDMQIGKRLREPTRPMIISIEGIPGSGKSQVIRKLSVNRGFAIK